MVLLALDSDIPDGPLRSTHSKARHSVPWRSLIKPENPTFELLFTRTTDKGYRALPASLHHFPSIFHRNSSFNYQSFYLSATRNSELTLSMLLSEILFGKQVLAGIGERAVGLEWSQRHCPVGRMVTICESVTLQRRQHIAHYVGSPPKLLLLHRPPLSHHSPTFYEIGYDFVHQ